MHCTFVVLISPAYVCSQSALESKKNCKVYGKANSSALTGVLSAKQGTELDTA